MVYKGFRDFIAGSFLIFLISPVARVNAQDLSLIDNFESGRLDNWTVFGPSWYVTNGTLVSATGGTIIWNVPIESDFVLQADLMLPTAAFGGIGLVYAFQDSSDYSSFGVYRTPTEDLVVGWANQLLPNFPGYIASVPIQTGIPSRQGMFYSLRIERRQSSVIVQVWDGTNTLSTAAFSISLTDWTASGEKVGFFSTTGFAAIANFRGRVVPSDNDKDGVPDYLDKCSDTPQGDIVNAEGCSIAQLVPCTGPWNNHGQYVDATKAAVSTFVQQRLISAEQGRTMVQDAAKCDCGKSLR